MKHTLIAAAFAVVSTAALAQTNAPNTTAGAQTPGGTYNTGPQSTSPSPSAVQTQNTTSRTAAAPVPGSNSFTMNEASKRIASAGYTNVSDLKKDGQGIWRGKAQKNGSQVGVALDYQGNVVSQ